MRKLILLSVALFISTMAFGQLEKGLVQLGGSVSFTSTDNGDNDVSAFNIFPRGGYFVSNNTSIGLQLGYTSITRDAFNVQTNSFVELTNQQVLFGAYARFHKSAADNFYLFLQPAFIFGTGEAEGFNSTDSDLNSFNIGVSPGVTYFLSPKFAVELSLGALSYTRNKVEGAGIDQTTNTFHFDLDLADINFGMSFYIR